MRCCVPMCDAKNKDQPKRTMFLVPKQQSLLLQWLKVLPNVRDVKSCDKVCHLHFNPDDVLYTFDHVINGQIYQLKRDRPKLKPNSVPDREMPTKDELASYKVKTKNHGHSKISKALEESLIKNETLDINSPQEYPTYDENQHNIHFVEQIIYSNTDTIEEYETLQDSTTDDLQTTTNDIETTEALPEEETHEYCEDDVNPQGLTTNDTVLQQEDSLPDLFDFIYDHVYDLTTPNSLWGIHRCPNRSIIYLTFMDMDEMKITKMITIDCDGVVKLFASSCLIKQLHLINDICNMEHLSSLLTQVDMWRYCFGKDYSPDCQIIVEPNADNSWSTDENEQVFFCTICLPLS